MSRDHRKLNVFAQADELIVVMYEETARFPADERCGLCAQLRRAAISIAANIVEGCARRSTREYLHFINIATGSAAETLYLLELSRRLSFLKMDAYERLAPKCTTLLKCLKALLNSLNAAP